LFQYTLLKPLADRVLVKIKSSEKTTGGILLPATAQSKPQGGEVVAIGEGRPIGDNKVDVSIQVYYPRLLVASMILHVSRFVQQVRFTYRSPQLTSGIAIPMSIDGRGVFFSEYSETLDST
jgi:hypothetical protein